MMLHLMKTSLPLAVASRSAVPARAISTRPTARTTYGKSGASGGIAFGDTQKSNEVRSEQTRFGQRPERDNSSPPAQREYEAPINSQATPSGIATTLDDVGESSARAYAMGYTGARGLPLGERGHAPPQERSHMPGEGSMSQGHMSNDSGVSARADSGGSSPRGSAGDAAAMGARSDQSGGGGVSGVPQYGRTQGGANALFESAERSGIGNRGDMNTHGMGGASQYNQGTTHTGGESSGFGEVRSSSSSSSSGWENPSKGDPFAARNDRYRDSDFGRTVRSPDVGERGGNKMDKDFSKRDSDMSNTSELGNTRSNASGHSGSASGMNSADFSSPSWVPPNSSMSGGYGGNIINIDDARYRASEIFKNKSATSGVGSGMGGSSSSSSSSSNNSASTNVNNAREDFQKRNPNYDPSGRLAAESGHQASMGMGVGETLMGGDVDASASSSSGGYSTREKLRDVYSSVKEGMKEASQQLKQDMHDTLSNRDALKETVKESVKETVKDSTKGSLSSAIKAIKSAIGYGAAGAVGGATGSTLSEKTKDVLRSAFPGDSSGSSASSGPSSSSGIGVGIGNGSISASTVTLASDRSPSNTGMQS